jgi:hypothetical protein
MKEGTDRYILFNGIPRNVFRSILTLKSKARKVKRTVLSTLNASYSKEYYCLITAAFGIFCMFSVVGMFGEYSIKEK